MKSVASIVLAGGQGKRLFPLTQSCCKPAIPFGGRYCLIDIPISNSIHSGIRHMFVISQYLSRQLQRHLQQTYQMQGRHHGFIELLGSEERPSGQIWFQGTADAVRQNSHYIFDFPADYFLILSGDQLYNLDFRDLIRTAQETNADLTIATIPIGAKDAHRMGILKIDDSSAITDFEEKPKDSALLERLRADDKLLERAGISQEDPRHYLASMGIYIFKREALWRLLHEDPREDFGKHLIPRKVREGNVYAHIYQGYWEDIGTIEAFYEANLAMTQSEQLFDCYNESRLIYSSTHGLPGPRVSKALISQSFLCEGAIVDAHEISHSILGPRAIVKRGTIIRDSYVMGHDAYMPSNSPSKVHVPSYQIGEDCHIERAIIDRNVHIGNGVKLLNQDKRREYDGDRIYIRDGVIVVTQGAVIPDGFTL